MVQDAIACTDPGSHNAERYRQAGERHDDANSRSYYDSAIG